MCGDNSCPSSCCPGRETEMISIPMSGGFYSALETGLQFPGQCMDVHAYRSQEFPPAGRKSQYMISNASASEISGRTGPISSVVIISPHLFCRVYNMSGRTDLTPSGDPGHFPGFYKNEGGDRYGFLNDCSVLSCCCWTNLPVRSIYVRLS